MIEIVRHTYAARFLHRLGPLAHFRQCSGLAEQSRARRLRRPRSLDQLPALVRRVEADLRRTANHSSPGTPAAV